MSTPLSSSESQNTSSQQHYFTPVPLKQVVIDDPFWTPRIRVNREQTIPHIYQLLAETGRLAAFRQDWQPGQEPVPHFFWDSDVAKWVEAASYSVATNPDPALEARLDEVIALIASAQQPDGYLNTHYTAVEPDKRWTNLRDCHELYCAGHLIEAAVAHFQATGKRTLLDTLCRYADYIDQVFGDAPGKKRGYPGHEELELALVKLYHATGELRYLRLSQYFVDERGRTPHYYDQEARARGEDPAAFWAKTYAYNQAHQPVREQTQVVGHAVRAMYLYSALADLAREQHDTELLQVCQRLWEHLCSTRLYITGGIGASYQNEGFTTDYDLPNETAYAETCAAIGLVFWSQRMLRLHCDRRYADIMERALYNGVLSGVSLDGKKFFYVNPLASTGEYHRDAWFSCSCCPPNVARLFASLGEYIYATNATDIAVHLYIQGTAHLTVGNHQVTLHQRTNYPWDGQIRLQLDTDQPATFGLRLRIPGWCHDAHLTVNGEHYDLAQYLEDGYACIERTWQAGDEVQLDLAMPIEHIYAHPGIAQDRGRVALQRGPLVYCLEEIDQATAIQRIVLPRHTEFASQPDAQLADGVIVLHGPAATLSDNGWQGQLYHTTPPRLEPTDVVAVPYFLWDNRAAGLMSVWLLDGGNM